MSWFALEAVKERKKIKGIWLRERSNPDVQQAIKKTKELRMTDVVWKIEIVELRKENKVLLEVWAKNTIDVIRKKHRNNVFHIEMTQNPEWICEGDLGRGTKSLI